MLTPPGSNRYLQFNSDIDSEDYIRWIKKQVKHVSVKRTNGDGVGNDNIYSDTYGNGREIKEHAERNQKPLSTFMQLSNNEIDH